MNHKLHFTFSLLYILDCFKLHVVGYHELLIPRFFINKVDVPFYALPKEKRHTQICDTAFEKRHFYCIFIWLYEYSMVMNIL